jgi:WD40 repeat protein/serine/threonine protein kinase
MPDDPKNSDSLGDDRTFAGERDVPPEEQQSLGDAGTHAGGMDSSISDRELNGQASDSDLPLIDLARFEIKGELGKGGMGAVQLATDRQLKRQVAIKRIHASSQSALKRFVTEAQSIAALNHFNIVQVYEFGRDEEGPLLVMEHVSGGSLLDRLKEGKLEVEDAISITGQLCDALTVAHQKGIIHRDIKPANILLTEEGVPKLTDFGLARNQQADHDQTMTGAVMGTLYYMAPEQRRDATTADARSDLWSLAATLYTMITGKTPDVIRLDQLPANLAPVIGKMLEEDPGERYHAAGDFKAGLRKGMTMAVPDVATPVAPNLVAGICPSCNTANETSRKFCRGCRSRLIEPCLSCEKDNPVWEDICGECGSSQQEERVHIQTAAAEKAAAEKAAADKAAADKAAADKAAADKAAAEKTAVTLQGHSNYVTSVSFSPDGRRIVSGSGDNTLKVWDAETGQETLTLEGHTDPVMSVSFSPDGRRIASGSFDNTLKVWDVETGQEMLTLEGHSGWVWSVAFSPDGRRIVSASSENTLKIWDAETSQELLTLKGHSDYVTSVAFSPDGRRIVSGSNDNTLKIWDAKTGQEMLTLKGHSKSVYSASFSPDGKRIVSGSEDETLKVWDAETGQEMFTLKRHSGWVCCASFSPDGKRIVSGSEDETLTVWDAETGQEMLTLEGHSGYVWSVAFSPDSRRIVSGSYDKTVKVWDARPLELEEDLQK